MRWLILAVALVSITILAAAQETVAPGRKSADTAPAAQSSQAASSVLNVPLFPTRRDGQEFARSTEHKASTNWRLTPLSSGCYTMRVYKVKRTESVKEGETPSRGYSTCEPGFEFQVRTAAATDHSQAK